MDNRTAPNIPSTPDRNRAFRDLKAKLERGATQAESGELLDGDEVFDELKELIEKRRRIQQR
jgi:predicted transcriptional regulator